MYIVNTTFVVEPKYNEQWYNFITTRFLPHLRLTGFSTDEQPAIFTKILANDPEPHFTYSIQVRVDDISTYQRFMDEVLSEYKATAFEVFAENVLHFTSLMKIMEH